jgi:hypothetical protein
LSPEAKTNRTDAMMQTTILKTETPPPTGNWQYSSWEQSEILSVDRFRPESSDHRPTTSVKMVYDDLGIHIIFRVEDAFVRCVQTELNSPVCTDSCVEFFVQPREDCGYFNFETNCGGTLFASYIEDWTRTENGFAKYCQLPQQDAAMVDIYHSLPKTVDPERAHPTTWINQVYIPFELLGKYVGNLPPVADHASWRGNLYKCGDKTSHPHWAAWSPVRALNFHDPESFGLFKFENQSN